jgi:hypothetical protein
MKIQHACTAIIVLLAAAACGPSGPGGSGLTGPTRDAFVQSSTTSCKAAARSNPRNAAMAADAIEKYCTCYSNQMADKLSYAELEEINKTMATDPAGTQAKLQARIDAAVAACRPAGG